MPRLTIRNRNRNSSTIRWRIDSLAWRLNETGGPKRLESGVYRNGDNYFSFGLTTCADDVCSINWFICRHSEGREVPLSCTFWLETADSTLLCDRQGAYKFKKTYHIISRFKFQLTLRISRRQKLLHW